VAGVAAQQRTHPLPQQVAVEAEGGQQESVISYALLVCLAVLWLLLVPVALVAYPQLLVFRLEVELMELKVALHRLVVLFPLMVAEEVIKAGPVMVK
jgi:hypothetical protein